MYSEAALSCFTEFRTDKNLALWHSRAAPSSGSGSGSGEDAGAGAVVSLGALDYLLSQLVAMRGVVLQYQHFLVHSCCLPALAVDEGMGGWAELDAVYASLEGLYLQRALEEAMKGGRVLVQLQGVMHSLRAVEDAFFVLQVSR